MRFLDDEELAYVASRAREVHDFWHVLFGCHTNNFGELALKAVEFVQVRNPNQLPCFLNDLRGTILYTAQHRETPCRSMLIVDANCEWVDVDAILGGRVGGICRAFRETTHFRACNCYCCPDRCLLANWRAGARVDGAAHDGAVSGGRPVAAAGSGSSGADAGLPALGGARRHALGGPHVPLLRGAL